MKTMLLHLKNGGQVAINDNRIDNVATIQGYGDGTMRQRHNDRVSRPGNRRKTHQDQGDPDTMHTTTRPMPTSDAYTIARALAIGAAMDAGHRPRPRPTPKPN